MSKKRDRQHDILQYALNLRVCFQFAVTTVSPSTQLFMAFLSIRTSSQCPTKEPNRSECKQGQDRGGAMQMHFYSISKFGFEKVDKRDLLTKVRTQEQMHECINLSCISNQSESHQRVTTNSSIEFPSGCTFHGKMKTLEAWTRESKLTGCLVPANTSQKTCIKYKRLVRIVQINKSAIKQRALCTETHLPEFVPRVLVTNLSAFTT